MKINYFFPVFTNDLCEENLNYFFKTPFFSTYENYKIIFCINKLDKNNLTYLKKISKNNNKIKILIFEKEFNYNDAFINSLKYFDGDIVLLGDLKIKKIDIIFNKCIEKKANIVHVFKIKKGFKGFIKNITEKFYNFFIKLFTGKNDRLNILSLGLIDKDILQILNSLPEKACFLKNTTEFKGFKSKSVFIDNKTITYTSNFNKKTTPLTCSICSISIFFFSALFALFINPFIDTSSPIIYILEFFIMLSSLLSFCLFLPKHFFNIRNCSNENFEIKEI